MDKEKKIAEILEALSAATPGPWAVFVGEGWTEEYPRNTYVQAVWNEPDHRGSFGYRVARMAGVHGRTMADAHLIANAPEWLGFLLDELEQTRKESNMLREELHKFQELAIKAANHHKAERDKLIEVLRWYADEENQKLDESTRYWENVYSPYEMDGGQRARDILREIGVTVK